MLRFRFIDTAGIRETQDTVENMGIERTFSKLEQADIVLWMIDGTQPDGQLRELADRIVPRCEGKHLFAIINKTDLLASEQIENKRNLLETFSIPQKHILRLSAKNDADIAGVEMALSSLAHTGEAQNDTIVTNIRHYEALVRAQESIRRARRGLAGNYPGDLLSQDIRETMHHLGEITGEITTDEILSNIFKNFCIGK